MSESSGRKRLVVLVSGAGTNLQAILDACACGELHADVAAVFSDHARAGGLERARRSGVPALARIKRKSEERGAYDAALADEVSRYSPDWVVLAGWMRVLSASFLSRFPGSVLNLHPALPGAFPGTRAIERALDAYRRGAISATGIMVHLVPNEGVDNGPVLAQLAVPIEPDDTLDMLEARVHAAEHRLLVDTLRQLVNTPASISG